LEKLLEEAQAELEVNTNELEISAKEIQDVGKQDSDANVNRAKVGKDSNRNANRFKLIEKPKRNPEVEKKVASASVGDVRSRHLTTFSTPWGLKRCTQLTFGTVIAQERFHEEVKKTISGVQGDKNITADIIIVYGKTPVTRPSTKRHRLCRN